jgi:tetratricopeptide (TPR) repeat protein
MSVAVRQGSGPAGDPPYVVTNAVTETPLQLSLNAEDDWLVAVEFGAVIDGKPDDEMVVESEHFGFYLDRPEGTVIGFWVDDLSGFDPGGLAGPIWDGPRFAVPVLGLESACAGEIVLAAKATFDEITTADNAFFDFAVEHQDSDQAELGWRMCLAAGNLKAHFALGYTLCEQGRFHEAYAHLRRYTELCPKNSWAWCWFGKACVGKGEPEEARRAFERAIELEDAGSFETDAGELLHGLGVPEGRE